MHDIRAIRENPAAFDAALARRGLSSMSPAILALDNDRRAKILAFQSEVPVTMPLWMGGKIHRTHRAALLFKAPEFYEQYGWKEQAKYDYYWPL
jgi:hypothetical protein